MNTNFNVSSQPSFSARLRVSGLKLDETKLAQVDKKFSELTQHYKKDFLDIQSNTIEKCDNPKVTFDVVDFTTGAEPTASSASKGQFRRWFNKRASVDEIANTFARIFKKGKFEEKELPQKYELSKRFDRLNSMEKQNMERFELTKNPIYSTLANQNAAAAIKTKAELDMKEAKIDATLAKIENFESSIPDVLYY